MKLTPALKAWLVENCGVKSAATDNEFLAAAGTAFADGKLTRDKYAELTLDEKAAAANAFAGKLDTIAGKLEKLTEALTAKAAQPEPKEEPKPAEEKGKEPEGQKATKPTGRIAKLFAGAGSDDEGGDFEVRVKAACERYTHDRKSLTYPTTTKAGRPHSMAGMPVMDYAGPHGSPMMIPSERDRAVIGAFAKFQVATAQKRSRNLAWLSMPSHDKELILHAMQTYDWVGSTDGSERADIVKRKLTEMEQKALIDDSSSGGQEAVPLVYDDAIISTPILNGELFPLVNTVPLDKGRLVNGAAVSTVTSEWGGVDDTAITLFDTTLFVSAFDTTIFRWQGAIRVGLDFMSDTPIDFAGLFTQQYGDVLLQELDDVIATGDGSSQPEGIMNKSGVTSVACGGTTTLGHYESLRFGVHKREHTPNMARTAVFCGTDVSYSRAMAIPVGASDNRRIMQTNQQPNYDGYTFMGRQYKINESLTNAQIFYAILGRYRMYRRRGLTIRTSTEGDTLIRNNEMLIVATARFGGQLERAAAACLTSTSEA